MDPLFLWIKEKAKLDWYELFKTFNCGIGMLVFVDKENSSRLLDHLRILNFNSWVVGEMHKKDRNKNSVQIINYE